jgi:hypothetical protein
MDDTSKICMVLLAILLNKSCLFVKLLELFHYICFVLQFLGLITWTNGNEHFLGPFWWIFNEDITCALKGDFLYERIVDNEANDDIFMH